MTTTTKMSIETNLEKKEKLLEIVSTLIRTFPQFCWPPLYAKKVEQGEGAVLSQNKIYGSKKKWSTPHQFYYVFVFKRNVQNLN